MCVTPTIHAFFIKSFTAFSVRKKHFLAAEEVFGYEQSDLIPEELVFLDAYQTVYAWIGKVHPHRNPKVTLEMVEEYLVMGTT